jgi:hypothetical protein
MAKPKLDTVDEQMNQDTLDSLRKVRRKLYSVPESELSGMSLDDQVKYGANLHQTGLAILRLETAKLKGVNDKFKVKESQLKEAASKVEADSAAITDTVKMIRAVSEGLAVVSQFVSFLA